MEQVKSSNDYTIATVYRIINHILSIAVNQCSRPAEVIPVFRRLWLFLPDLGGYGNTSDGVYAINNLNHVEQFEMFIYCTPQTVDNFHYPISYMVRGRIRINHKLSIEKNRLKFKWLLFCNFCEHGNRKWNDWHIFRLWFKSTHDPSLAHFENCLDQPVCGLLRCQLRRIS